MRQACSSRTFRDRTAFVDTDCVRAAALNGAWGLFTLYGGSRSAARRLDCERTTRTGLLLVVLGAPDSKDAANLLGLGGRQEFDRAASSTEFHAHGARESPTPRQHRVERFFAKRARRRPDVAQEVGAGG